jgi:hypothetical protein
LPLESSRIIKYLATMNTVEEIEQAAERLAPSDFDRLASWVSARYHELWKRQMDTDASAGKLDFLFNEADAERQAGSLKDWPADKE